MLGMTYVLLIVVYFAFAKKKRRRNSLSHVSVYKGVSQIKFILSSLPGTSLVVSKSQKV
jgi:hypothetical protein